MLQVASFLILVVAPWFVIRAVLCPAFVRAFFRISLRLAGALLAYELFVVNVALVAPGFLPALAVTSLCVVAAERWRARESFGQSRGLPPGSVSPLDLRVLFHQSYAMEEWRRHGPVFKGCFILKPVVYVVGLERGIRLLEEHGKAGRIRPPDFQFGRAIPGGFIRSMDSEKRAKYRDVIKASLSPAVVQHHETSMRQVFHEVLLRAAEDSAMEPACGIRLRPYINRMVFAAWSGLFWGLPPDSPEIAWLKARYRILDIRNPCVSSPKKIQRTMDEVQAWVISRIHALRQMASRNEIVPDSFLSRLITARPDVVEDPTVVGNLIYIMHTSWSDVTGFLQWLAKILGENPSWLEKLREPDQPADLPSRMIQEVFRLEQSEFIARVAHEEFTFEGFTIPKGWLVRICVRESHRDPAVYASPETFNPDRFIGITPSPDRYLPFGYGDHACLGVAVTMAAGRALLCELAHVFSWKITKDGPPEFSSWRHWRPNSSFRVSIEALKNKQH